MIRYIVNSMPDETTKTLGKLPIPWSVEGLEALSQQVNKLGGEGVELEDGLLAGHGDIILVLAVALLYPQYIPTVRT